MGKLIDAEKLKNFFFSETSGTEDIIRDMMDAHGLDYVNDIDEDAVMAFAEDLLKAVKNVIDTEPTAYDVDAVVKQLEEEQEKLDTSLWAVENGDWYAQRCNGINDGLEKAIEIVKGGGVDAKTDS